MEALDFDLRCDLGRGANAFTLAARARLERPTAILGPSGAGKSTLLALLAGLRRPTRGRVALGEDVFVDTARGVWVPPWKRRLGVVFQDARLWPHQRVRDQIRFGGRHDENAAVALCDLAPLMDRRPRSLSGGERRRVAIARALMSGPRALLLDEPMAGLDGARREGIRELIARLAASLDLPVVVVTHELSEALTIAPQVLLLRDGRVVGGGPGALGDLARRGECFDLAQSLGFESLLRVEITGRGALGPGDDARWAVTYARLAGPEPHEPLTLTLPPTELPVGTLAWVAVRPEDVLVSRSRVRGLSARNQLPGQVGRCAEVRGRVLADVELAGGQRLQAELTRTSRDALDLAPGRAVWALVKTWAPRWRGRVAAAGPPAR